MAAGHWIRASQRDPTHRDRLARFQPFRLTPPASRLSSHCRAAFPCEYVDTRKIRFIFREFPTNDAALAAFMIARAAPREAYFPLMDVFFETLETWAKNPAEGLLNIAKQAGFTQAKFEETLKNEALAKGILDIRSGGEKFGVQGTPTFFLNGEKFEGRAFADFKAAIDPLL